jgi:hypothetical protein
MDVDGDSDKIKLYPYPTLQYDAWSYLMRQGGQDQISLRMYRDIVTHNRRSSHVLP